MTTETTATETRGTPRDDRYSDVGWLCLGFGLATGWGVVFVEGILRGLSFDRLFLNPHFVWLGPVADALLFIVLGGPVLALLIGRLPKGVFLPLAVGAMSFVGCVAAVISSGRIFAWAAALLAAGVAGQLSRLARARPDTVRVSCRRAAVALLALTALAAACVWGLQRYEDRRGLPSNTVATAGSPNVLLIVLDTVRADSVNLDVATENPASHPTPFLARLAGNSLVFDAALAPSSWTLPSHASMFTGKPAHQLTADWYEPLDDRERTLAEVFRDRGYATGGFVGNTKYAARGTGLERGFAHYEDFPWTFGELIRHSIFVRLFEQKGGRFTALGIYDDLGHKPAPAVTDGFLAWTDRLDGQPFFAFLNYFDAHSPYLPDRHPVEERALTPEEKTRLRGWLTADRETLHRETEFAHACFRELVRQLDQELERLFLELDARGLRENTLVIVTSDHGEQFGEHDLFHHGNSLYRPLVHVPLIVNWPAGISERVHVDRAVSLTDLGATLADALNWPNADRLPGQSFWPAAPGDAEPMAPAAICGLTARPHDRQFHYAPVAGGSMFAVLHNGLYLIRQGDGTEQVFDFHRDPMEQHDLVNDPAAQAAIAELRELLDGLIGR
jgi:arylsulfatase A-like enzyme